MLGKRPREVPDLRPEVQDPEGPAVKFAKMQAKNGASAKKSAKKNPVTTPEQEPILPPVSPENPTTSRKSEENEKTPILGPSIDAVGIAQKRRRRLSLNTDVAFGSFLRGTHQVTEKSHKALDVLTQKVKKDMVSTPSSKARDRRSRGSICGTGPHSTS